MTGINLFLHTDDFESFDADALARVQAVNPDPSMTSYTFAYDDATSGSWAKIEQDFFDVASEAERSEMKTKVEAIAAGMVIVQGE